ncbi:MAG: DMT family transporter [Patescibacteria group bacterium]
MKIFTKTGLDGPIFIIVAAILWALDGVIRRYLYSLPPITIIFFEHLIGLIILTPFIWKKLFTERINKKDVGLLVIIAILSGLLGTLWFTTALLKVHFISFSVVFLLQKLQPIFAIGSASIFLKEKLDKRYIKWALLAIVAAYFVTFKNGHVDLATGEGTIVAALYALGAAFAWGTSTTFSKMVLTKISFGVSTFYRFLFTSIITAFVILILGYGNSLTLPTLGQFGLFTLIAVSTGMVALVIYYRGLARTPVHISTILELTFPFIAIFIDTVLYNSVLSLSQWVATFILVFAIYKVARLQSYAVSSKTN